MPRLFELTTQNTPDDTYRFAFGKAGNVSLNIRIDNFKTWLLNTLGFLKVSEDLSDLNNKTDARTNLGVYSKTEIDTALDDKADVTNVLEKDNTTVYTPTTDYHPATKVYVDNLLDITEDLDNNVISGGVTYGVISFYKIGKVVSGIFEVGANDNGGSRVTADFSVPAALRPRDSVGFTRRDPTSSEVNYIEIQTSGTITIGIDYVSGNPEAKNIGFSYITS